MLPCASLTSYSWVSCGHEGAVLDDERDLVRGDGARADELLLLVVGDEVAGGLTRVHVEARDAPGVVVVEHQPRALLVGVEEGLDAVVGDVAYGVMSGTSTHVDALRPRRGLVGRRDPLVRRAVADPRADAAVEVQRGAVVLEAVGRLGRLGADRVTHPVHHGALVDRDRGGPWGPCRSPSACCRSGRKRSPSAPVGSRLRKTMRTGLFLVATIVGPSHCGGVTP